MVEKDNEYLYSWDLSSEYVSCDSDKFTKDISDVTNFIGQIRSSLNEFKGGPFEFRKYLLILDSYFKCLKKFYNLQKYITCASLVTDDSKNAVSEQKIIYLKTEIALLEVHIISCVANENDHYLHDDSLSDLRYFLECKIEEHSEKIKNSDASLAVQKLAPYGIDAWFLLYEKISSNIDFKKSSNGLGLSELLKNLQEQSEASRRDAFLAIEDAWGKEKELTALALNSISGWRLESQTFNSEGTVDVVLNNSLKKHGISLNSFKTLEGVADENMAVSVKANLLKAKLLSKAKIDHWDLNAPAPSSLIRNQKLIPIDLAFELIENMGQVLGEPFQKFIHEMRNNRLIEARSCNSKFHGAFSTYFPKSKLPRIYMNYTGSLVDLYTLVHELFHAFHSFLLRDMPLSHHYYPMALAETVALFGEKLMMDYMLSKDESNNIKTVTGWRNIHNSLFISLIMARHDFEYSFYAKRLDGPLSPSEINELYTRSIRKYYGESIDFVGGNEWQKTKHFFMKDLSFANIPYLFAFLTSNGLHALRSEISDSDFFKSFYSMIKESALLPLEVLLKKHFGVDVESKDFWEQAFREYDLGIESFNKEF